MNEDILNLLGVDVKGAKEKAFARGLLSTVLNAAQLSGPQRTPVSNVQALGQLGLGAMQAYDTSFDSVLKDALTGLQVKKTVQELEAARRQQQALDKLRGGGAGGAMETMSIADLQSIAANPDLPKTDREMAAKIADQRMAAQQQQFSRRIEGAKFQYETGMEPPGMEPVAPQVSAQRVQQVPTQQVAAQEPTAQPAQVVGAPQIKVPDGLSPKQAQEYRVKFAEAQPKVFSSVSSAIQQVKDTKDIAQKLLNDKEALDALTGQGAFSGTTARVMANVPGTKAYEANLLLENLQSRNFVNTIQKMRQESPTGGAVGAVAVQEMERLASIPAALKSGVRPEFLKDQLNQLIRLSDAAEKSLVESYERDYGSAPQLRSISEERGVVNVQNIPQGAIDLLAADPSLAPMFDQKYGKGASKRFIKGK